MVTVTVKVDEALLGELDSLAQKKELTRSAAMRQALVEYTAGAQAQYGSIPQDVRAKIDFLEFLVTEGEPDDFDFVKREVAALWMSVQ